MQRAYFPMNVINLTQGYGDKTSTHKYSYALDLAGKDSGSDDVFAPFDCKITKLYQPSDTKNHANTVWLTSLNEVECANGYKGYLTISITHPSEISKMKLGTIYKQGDKICTEGKTGNASGNHIHLEVGKGKNCGWENIKNNWIITNKVKPEEYLFIKKNSTIKNDTYKGDKYNFIVEKDDPIFEDNTNDYVIQSGDTLTKIANKFNTSVDELVKLNNIENPNLIYAGDTIKIPSNNTDIEYTVKKGDTLSSIASKCDTTYQELAKYNNIDNPDLIYPNQVIKIPKK